jgi:cobalt-precorrin 5A hydrolase/precorrin-3B C17-methyltransferase
VIGLFAVTPAGLRAAADVASGLGPDAVLVEGPIKPALDRLWPKLGAAVFFLSTGATVRLVAPLLGDRQSDPGVVCVDDDRKFAVALAGEANVLAERVADALGCVAVTTSTSAAGSTPADDLAELLDAAVDGDLAGCGRAILDGDPVRLLNPLGFPLPPLPSNVRPDVHGTDWTVLIDDRLPALKPPGNLVRLVPRTLVVGVGCGQGVSSTAVTAALGLLESDHDLDPRAVRSFATLDAKAGEDGILSAVEDWGFWHGERGGSPPPLALHTSAELSVVDVPNPSAAVQAETGTASVAEAAALLTAQQLGGTARVQLAAPKTKGDNVTVAAARILPRGRLALVGLGPGDADLRTPRADAELRRASVVVGPAEYVDQVRHLLHPGAEILAAGARRAAELAAEGRSVALVGSGDAGVYAMAGPVLEHVGSDVDVVGVPGVTAALAASSLLGAPLGHDHALISLSDKHTAWPVIERRIRAAAEGDFVVCLYNTRQEWQLAAALDILREVRSGATPVGAVTGTRPVVCALEEFRPGDFDIVIVGSSATVLTAGHMITPRGSRIQLS